MSSFTLRSSTLRLGIFISALIIAVILIFQLTWLRKVYRFEQKEFDHSVVKSIRGLYEDLNVTSYTTSSLNELIEKPARDLYIAHVNWPVNTDSLTRYLQFELDDFEIFTSCQLGVYNAKAGNYIYHSFLPSAIGKENNGAKLPVIQRPYDYIALLFPNREHYILSQMNFWIISSAVLLIVLVLLSGSLYYFYKQKFLNETQKDFIHNFTHEFKTPVSVIRLAADVLKDRSIIEKPAKLSTYAHIVEYQANYLHTQIERLLKFAYTDSNHIHLEKKPVNLHELVTEAISNLAPLIDEKKAIFHYKMDATTPILQADKDYLIIVITNIIDNALKYSRNPEISIGTTNTLRTLTLSVKDNGIGIERNQFKKLFRKFYRVPRGEVYTAKGFGIGLSFAQKIITAHKGTVTIESDPGKGSNFIVEFPSI